MAHPCLRGLSSRLTHLCFRRRRQQHSWDAEARGYGSRHAGAKSRFLRAPQFQTELRKILVSLIEVAQKLLALNPDAVELFRKANGMSSPRLMQPVLWPRPSTPGVRCFPFVLPC